ncbi:hypothetical protein JMA_06450 [Jeotgalibacillus malaysiensis]|uniref:DUF3307 domain-containing protein n=1 Tax=Jeotgalibacillus malaysiensis TaxID=1508404 RepID=A0A0B5AMS2_9BACL|nr:DUF3307 domain-containing protein [Jeotgalibacillus malaysiensis]AJD89962.1 hypothetical protein JMA_06450 [Jeotgalibacillus malaysiensis]
MTPFSYLFLSHLIGDYLFQTSWMAGRKKDNWAALLTHCFVYTLTVAVIAFFTFGGLSLIAILFVFTTHVLIDKQFIVQWWVTHIMSPPPSEKKWLTIIVDQIFHLIVLAIALFI